MKKNLICLSICFLLFLNLTTAIVISNPMTNIWRNNYLFIQSDENIFIELDLNSTSYGHELLWKVNTTGTNYEESAVAYIDGIAYIGSCSTHGQGHDKLFAVNTTNGEIIWITFTGPGYVGPVIDNDVIYFGTSSHGHNPYDEYMYAFNRYDGSEIWKVNIYGGIPESVQYDEKKIYFCSDTGGEKIYALNKEDGNINWTYDTGLYNCANKPMLKDNALYAAYFENYVGEMYKLNVTDGSEIWKISLSGGPWDNSITADGEGRIYMAIYSDRTMNAYSEDNGSLLWSYILHGPPLSFNAYHNRVVFIADTDGYVYAFNSINGELMWENKIGGKIDISSPTISGGLIFVGTRDDKEGAFFALNEITGEIVWKYKIGASITAPPSIADGMMLCGTDGWYMYAFDVGIGSGDWLLHRYDSHNTAYSPNGLTTWQYVEADCITNNGKTVCVLTNNYDHNVKNITLQAPFKAYWYDQDGKLLKAESDTFIIDSLASFSQITFLITQNPLLEVSIVKPDNGIYLLNKKITKFIFPLIIGKITIETELEILNLSDIYKVEFYVDGNLTNTTYDAPFHWMWGKRAFLRHTIMVKAYDKMENIASDEITVWKFF